MNVCLQPSVSIMQCACPILSSVACPAVQSFSTLHLKRHEFRKKNLTQNLYLFSLVLLCEKFLILKRSERDIIINAYRYSSEVPAILVRFWGSLNLLTNFRKIIKYEI